MFTRKIYTKFEIEFLYVFRLLILFIVLMRFFNLYLYFILFNIKY